MRILASLVEGLNIHLVDISIRVGVGLRGLINVVFMIGAGSLIIDLLTIWRRFLLNSADIVKTDILIDYIAGTANQFGAVFKGIGIIGR